MSDGRKKRKRFRRRRFCDLAQKDPARCLREWHRLIASYRSEVESRSAIATSDADQARLHALVADWIEELQAIPVLISARSLNATVSDTDIVSDLVKRMNRATRDFRASLAGTGVPEELRDSATRDRKD